ncbi:MAG TPA: SDR family oxidoreductase [Dyella sp.]|uniref:SDR family NAD(P)-dependent oxidoreductase n=1 Tax=Dyella sp. TaxID=1869338 RepID=UPI002F95DA41
MTQASTSGTAVITGASSGIGAIYADRLARRGYDLILVARNQQRLEQLAQRLREQTGRAVSVLPADLTAPADLAKVEAVLRNDASITMLVNNAGFGAATPLLEADIGKMDQMIALNVQALTRLTYAVAPSFVARKNGAIINIGSIVAVAPELLNGVYGGSKAYVQAFSQSLKHELADKGVRVQVVLPGATATEFWDVAGVPVTVLPEQIVMSAEDMVDAALAGFDQGEFATVPALPQVADWQKFEEARLALGPNLSHAKPASRYGVN